VLDPRPRLDEAAQVPARSLMSGWLCRSSRIGASSNVSMCGNTGWHIAETVVAGLAHGHQLWFGDERKIGLLREIAADLDVAIRVTP